MSAHWRHNVEVEQGLARSRTERVKDFFPALADQGRLGEPSLTGSSQITSRCRKFAARDAKGKLLSIQLKHQIFGQVRLDENGAGTGHDFLFAGRH